MTCPHGVPSAKSKKIIKSNCGQAQYIMDHLCSPHSDPTKREEHLRPYVLSALGNNEHLGVSDSDEASGEESHSQTEADELRDALKAETGYASYGDYLEAYSAEYPDLDSVMRRLMAPHLDILRRQWSKFTILDLSKDENTRPASSSSALLQ